MMYKTHIITGLAAGAGIAATQASGSFAFTVTYAAGITLGSLLPDLDQPKSFVGQRSLGLAKIISKLFGHRGFTHSLMAWCIVTAICLLFTSNFTIGISLGYLFHIVGDFFSVSSVPLFKPFSNFRPRNMWFSYKNESLAEESIKYIAILIFIYFFIVHELYKPFSFSIITNLKDVFGMIVNVISAYFL
ncbi:metal-dependent hydrolase [Bacillus massiliigorillae]|uniref:metal-dependent hydrolase n=1 Tax=Bacillus massiliigorillae TaxID=1243664 RepID=UPI00039DB78B|nr:metal-dependent hydrolase [Bacillus massiliigorillae]